MVSFVVPAYNEEALIAATIRGIHDAARSVGEPYEIVVADDGSDDGTGALARSLDAVVIRVANRQIAATRNAGARAARGKWLIFVDADTVVSEGAVRGAIEAMRGGAAGGGSSVRFDGWVPWHARLILPAMMVLYRVIGIASGSFLFCTRATFVKCGGFDESFFASEEIWMSRAIRSQGRFVFVRHPVTTSGRKLRTHSAREIYGLMFRLVIRGSSAVRRREGLDLWYGDRRDHP